MKVFALFLLFISHSVLACDIKEIRKDVFSQFQKNIPVTSKLGEQFGVTTLKEMSMTDSMMRIRGEDFFITRLVFNIIWANGLKEEKEVLMAAVVDMANCQVESMEPGDIMGSSISKR